ncbi:nickel pincer cofactor biosynthesis protein LarC [Kineococcus glutinatus]|uniref:Pyridinium-3,5-bisthiocarboxylic acid mononucleotide nickel insertion protein n=1 Tax=Kineococcus glutinatus TaxID=1070872 RepID=A0ABP9I7S9_9ACTN
MIGWLHCASGASGDMLLGALVGAGVLLEVLAGAVDAVAPEPVRLRVERVRRAGLAATRVHVEAAGSHVHRTWADVRALLDAAALEPVVAARAQDAFARLAAAEARVHGTSPEEVHFHEVGALDAVADVVGVCAGLAHLGLEALHVSPVALGGGTVRAAHGRLPVPGPAVVELLAGVPSHGGPVDVELTTPTGAALLVAHASAWGWQPPMRVARQGAGAGARELPGQPNVLRLLLGEPVGTPVAGGSGAATGGEDAVLLETNVDDLDPRLWPGVLAALLAAGAADAWLTPVLMKKGRPAHVLGVLVEPAGVEAAAAVVLGHTSAIGLRTSAVRKHPLPRRWVEVEVGGQPVRVKLAERDGRVVTAQPEFADVAAAAVVLRVPERTVLARATAAARDLLP